MEDKLLAITLVAPPARSSIRHRGRANARSVLDHVKKQFPDLEQVFVSGIRLTSVNAAAPVRVIDCQSCLRTRNMTVAA